jgi:hypothetical protein
MRRVPIKISAFHLWLNSTNNYLQSEDPANPGHFQWERLGLTSAEATWWDDQTTAWNELHAKWGDKNLRTLSIVRALRDLRKFITKGSRGIVNRIAVNPVATQYDATVFNFVLVRKEPTRRKTDIKDQLFASVNRNGSAEYEVKCRYDEDAKRAALLPGSDGVECSYMVVDTEPPRSTTINPSAEGFSQRTYIKARFIFKAGTGNKGKFLLIAFRWNFSPNTDFNGPWTQVQVLAIY